MSESKTQKSKALRMFRALGLLMVASVLFAAAPAMATTWTDVDSGPECTVEAEYKEIKVTLRCKADENGRCSAKVSYDPETHRVEASCEAGPATIRPDLDGLPDVKVITTQNL